MKMLVVLTVLLGFAVVFTLAAEAQTIYALLVIMDGDPVNYQQYEKSSKLILNLLQAVQNKRVCDVNITSFNSGSNNAQEWPTRARILKWVREVRPGRNDAIFIYYVGHGARDILADDNVFGGTFFDLTGEYLFRKELVNTLRSSSAWQCRLKMLITDTCSTDTSIQTPTQFLATSPATGYPKERVYRQLFVEHKGFLHITSATEGEYSWGDSTNGGWFTNGLVRSINSHADALSYKFVDWNEVLTDAQTEVNEFIEQHKEKVGYKFQHPKAYSLPDLVKQSGNVPPHGQSGNVPSYDVNRGGRLTIDADIGTIDVQTAVRNRVEVVVVKETKSRLDRWSQEALADFKVTSDRTGSNVSIKGKFERGRNYWRGQLNQLKIHFQVTVPRQYNVDLNTSRDNISVADLAGDVQARTSAGDIHVRNVVGKIRTQTSAGDLHFNGVEGPILGKTSAGDITLGDCRGYVDAKTSAGDIRADLTTQPQYEWNLLTSAGDIVVTLISNIAVEIDAQTTIGDVSTDFRVQGTVTRSRLRGTINGGWRLLKLRTSAGDIRLHRR